MDFRYPYPLAYVWLCVLKGTKRFYHIFKRVWRNFEITSFLGLAALIIAPTVVLPQCVSGLICRPWY
jgi:hypothetical protein